MDIRKLRSCEVCKTNVPANQIKMLPRDKERNWILCSPCCDKMKSRQVTATTVPPVRKTFVKEAVRNIYLPKIEKQEKGKEADYKRMYCNRCHYRFKLDTSRSGIYFRACCPYCGKDDQLDER
ncbi:hypothetical protein HYU21_03580 [Candidatus Woesearchaeota archaeon]|nr:hypothetical protein [Candidatus Woesearchaeota archaeon]